MLKRNLSLFAVLISVLLLSGCGGGGGGGSSVSTSPSSKTGIFVDDIVEGIYYKSDTSSGFTNSKGEFPFNNKKVEFFIGDIKIGEISNLPSDKKVFVQDLVGLSRDNITDPRVINIATFLQSLDNDKDTDNIKINRSDFDKFEAVNGKIEDMDISNILTSKGFSKKTEDEVKQHLSRSFAKYNDYTFDQKEKDFLFNELKTNYFWSNQVENKPYSQYSDPNKMINSFKYKQLDKWSYAETFEDYNKGLVQEDSGFGCHFRENRIFFIEIDSPCDKSELKRGDFLEKVNGKYVDQSIFDTAKNNKGVEATFTILRNGTSLDINITPNVYTFKVSKRQIIINENDKKVGYFIFDAFSAKSTEEIEEAFTYFKVNQIEELIVDFRFNGGGSANTASILLDKIAGYNNDDKVQFYLKKANSNEKENSYFMKDDNSLDLERVFFLTSEHSASASELVINSLKPYMDVKVIGTKTHGKPVGMQGRYISSKYIYWLINFSVYNSNDEGEYFDGLNTHCLVSDNIDYSRGDKSEYLLAEALYFTENNQCSSIFISDNDIDGIMDNIDLDDDNDGINDTEDVFPLNAKESKDNDLDGIGDNADNDDDNDGTQDHIDYQPFNSSCYKEKDGDGVNCYIDEINKESYTRESIYEKNGMYIILNEEITNLNKLYIYDYSNQEFKSIVTLKNKSISSRTFSKNENSLYIGYKDGEITKIDLNEDLKEQNILNVKNEISNLEVAGNYLVFNDTSDNKKMIYSKNAELIYEYAEDVYLNTDTSLWNSTTNKFYSYNEQYIKYEIINQNTGLIDDTYKIGPLPLDHTVKSKISISKDSSRILIAGKNIYNSSDLTWIGSLPQVATSFEWSSGNELAYSYSKSSNNSTLEIIDNNHNIIAQKDFPGKILNISNDGIDYILLIRNGNKIKFIKYNKNTYIPEEKNIDTDLDKSKCYECYLKDVRSRNIFEMDNLIIFVGSDEVVRFNIDTKKFVDKISINSKEFLPVKFHGETKTLYLTEEDGRITRIDFRKNSFNVEPFVNIPGIATDMEFVNDLLIVNSFDKRFVYNINKKLIYSNLKYGNAHNNTFSWNSKRQKFYYYENYDLFFEEINLLDGTKIARGKLVDRADYSGSFHGIFESKVILGKDVYNLDTLNIEKTFDKTPNVFYIDSDIFIYNSENNRELIVLDSTYSLIEKVIYNGEIRKVLKYDNKFLVISESSDKNSIEISGYLLP